MFIDVSDESFSEMGELEFIRRLIPTLNSRDDIVVGAGDDTAVVQLEGGAFDLLLTSDPVIEGVHFERGADEEAVGYKAVARAVSDIAAMGGVPAWLLVNLVAPRDMAVSGAEALMRSAVGASENFGAAIVGGDVTEGRCLEVHVFAVGNVPKGTAVLRSGASTGDLLYVTGQLGGSLCRGRHLSFKPRVAEASWLREGGFVSSMIDISDGLATDLRHMLVASDQGAELFLNRLPIHPDTAGGKKKPVEHALYDGEDFELLFTVPAEKKETLEHAWSDTHSLRLTCVGAITDDAHAIQCVGFEGARSVLDTFAFEHFRI